MKLGDELRSLTKEAQDIKLNAQLEAEWPSLKDALRGAAEGGENAYKHATSYVIGQALASRLEKEGCKCSLSEPYDCRDDFYQNDEYVLTISW